MKKSNTETWEPSSQVWTSLVSFAVLNLYVISFVELPFDLWWDTNLNLSVLYDTTPGSDKFVSYATMIFHDGCSISEILNGFSDLIPDTISTLGVK